MPDANKILNGLEAWALYDGGADTLTVRAGITGVVKNGPGDYSFTLNTEIDANELMTVITPVTAARAASIVNITDAVKQVLVNDLIVPLPADATFYIAFYRVYVR